MAVLKRTSKQRVIVTSLAVSMFVGLGVYVLLLIATAAAVGASELGEAGRVAAAGPIKLFEMQRIPLPDGGFEASMQYFSGTLAYFAGCLVLGAVVAFSRIRQRPYKS